MQVFHSLEDHDLIGLLQSGAVGVLPTDTVYGLVASAHSQAAVERMYALKDRQQKPGPTIAANVDQLADLGIEQAILDKVAAFWPAPLSIILPVDERLQYVSQGREDSPFRVVDDEALCVFLQQVGPLVTSSANLPGEPPAENLKEAQGYFGNRVDFYVDGGHISDRQPSTIARLGDNDQLEVIRQGAAQINSGDPK